MEQVTQERKPYEQPAVVYETELEVRAGTPVGIPDPLDLTGTKWHLVRARIPVAEPWAETVSASAHVA